MYMGRVNCNITAEFQRHALYAQTNNPDFVNTVEIGFTNNKGDQNFTLGDYLELDSAKAWL